MTPPDNLIVTAGPRVLVLVEELRNVPRVGLHFVKYLPGTRYLQHYL